MISHLREQLIELHSLYQEPLTWDEIILKIEPNGLLTSGMYARGEIVLQDEFSVEQRINITLVAEFTGDGRDMDFTAIVGIGNFYSSGI